MEREQLLDYLNTTVTAGLGIAGVLTGGSALQAAAFLPAVAHALCTDLLPAAKTDREAVERELKELVKKACISTQEILSKNSKEMADFFQYANARIEMNMDVMPFADIINIIKRDLEDEKKWQSVYITQIDIQEMTKLFVENFLAGLPEYPSLEHLFVVSSLLDHEQRLSNLEEKLTPALKVEPLPAADGSGDMQFYVEKYSEALFLHRRLPPDRTISLEDVYTLARADSVGQWRNATQKASYENIKDALKEFIDHAPQKPGDRPFDILFLEGQAAMGKSSLVAWLCAHYSRQDDISKEIIGGRRLIAIKLRDISSEEYPDGLNLQQPFVQFYSYLLNVSERQLSARNQWKEECRKFFHNTLLVLDGFDELCMVKDFYAGGKSIYFQNMFDQLSQMDCNCKIIVTTRPAYLNVEGLDFHKAHLVICPFGPDKRREWLNQYEAKESVPDDIKQVLLRDDIDALNGIADSPLTLYMIVAQNIRVSETSNLWDIYRQIFAEEVYQRNYEKGAPHEINQYRDFLYRLTAEIANAVSAEEHFYITIEKLLEVRQIRTLLDKLHGLTQDMRPDYERIKTILEDCFGLASYFRISEKQDEDGISKCAVEFYHNNIKDYFCCEYIWMNLERIYAELPSYPPDRDRWFIYNFQNLFQYSVFLKDRSTGGKSMPIRFLESKILYLKSCGTKIDFICQEMQNRYFPRFFGEMLQTGILYQYEYTGRDNILNMMACIYSAVFAIYHTIYMAYLPEGERLPISEKRHTVNISTSFIYRVLFPSANIYDQSRISFDGIMFSGISFGRHDFKYSSFRGCLMIGCDFENCDLRGADFTSASLQHADLSKAIIDKTTIFKHAELEFTKIVETQRQYMGAQPENSLLIIDA
ncbi:MAG: pentapeptide repeat-containing protein [Oscillibacter sp.]|nr:pentapeptide repeat-containing protein [Oscillibacter sp.]